MARRTNVTGIKSLSIGATKNSRGHVLSRYCVNHKVSDKPICKSFYFGENNAQIDSFKSAINYMIDNKLYDQDIKTALSVFKLFNHEDLL